MKSGSISIPNITDFPVTVNITNPSFQSVSDLSIALSLTHPTLSELSAVLIPPVGSDLPPLTLFNNRTSSTGATLAGQGITGANMGTTASGIRLGTVFDDQATRLITDTTAAAPYTSYFRPEGDGSTTTSGNEIDTRLWRRDPDERGRTGSTASGPCRSPTTSTAALRRRTSLCRASR